MKTIDAYNNAVGNCPICNKNKHWFNSVPLKAFCWGTESNPHNEVSRLVPSPYQPYGKVTKSKWVISK